MESIFTKIIKGDIPAHCIYEDERVIAILDIHPMAFGHTLVIPKQQIDHVWDIDDELYAHTMMVAKRIAERQREVLRVPRVGMMISGHDVPHAHIHVIPLYKGLIQATIEFASSEQTEAGQTELAAMAEQLRS